MVDTAQRSAPTTPASPSPAAPKPATTGTFTPMPTINVPALSRQLLGTWP